MTEFKKFQDEMLADIDKKIDRSSQRLEALLSDYCKRLKRLVFSADPLTDLTVLEKLVQDNLADLLGRTEMAHQTIQEFKLKEPIKGQTSRESLEQGMETEGTRITTESSVRVKVYDDDLNQPYDYQHRHHQPYRINRQQRPKTMIPKLSEGQSLIHNQSQVFDLVDDEDFDEAMQIIEARNKNKYLKGNKPHNPLNFTNQFQKYMTTFGHYKDMEFQTESQQNKYSDGEESPRKYPITTRQMHNQKQQSSKTFVKQEAQNGKSKDQQHVRAKQEISQLEPAKKIVQRPPQHHPKITRGPKIEMYHPEPEEEAKQNTLFPSQVVKKEHIQAHTPNPSKPLAKQPNPYLLSNPEKPSEMQEEEPPRQVDEGTGPKCMVCQQRFDSRADIVKHIIEYHNKMKENTECLYCSEPAGSIDELVAHLMQDHMNMEDEVAFMKRVQAFTRLINDE